MKKLLILICVAMALAISCFSRTIPINPLMIPVLIVHEKGAGSDVFLQLSNSVYLATARHVLFSEPEGTNPPVLLSSKATVISYSLSRGTNISERTVNLDLVQLLNAVEVHFSTNRDVALVRIEDCQPSNPEVVRLLPGVTFVTPEVSLKTYSLPNLCLLSDVDVGADVFMFGYPTSLTATAPIRNMFDPTQPLLRKGIVAGISPNKRIIIVDCPSYQGNSGGPVLQVDHPSLGEMTFKIIGLVSSFVPFQEEWENKTYRYSYVGISNSGYTVIVPIDAALELVWK